MRTIGLYSFVDILNDNPLVLSLQTHLHRTVPLCADNEVRKSYGRLRCIVCVTVRINERTCWQSSCICVVGMSYVGVSVCAPEMGDDAQWATTVKGEHVGISHRPQPTTATGSNVASHVLVSMACMFAVIHLYKYVYCFRVNVRMHAYAYVSEYLRAMCMCVNVYDWSMPDLRFKVIREKEVVCNMSA